MVYGYALKMNGQLCFPVCESIESLKSARGGIIDHLIVEDGGVMTLEFVKVRIEEVSG